MITQRKMAIAMYGYGWLKPAGCAKTMLGRREEEVEREEVERQLREVEMQERAAQEAEEQERQARLGETGEPDEGRDLDEDIPDMDVEGEEEEEEEDEVDLDGEIPDMDGDEDGMEGDLDDEIPEPDDDENDDDDEVMSPDPDGIDSNWVYDSRREPDTDDEMQHLHASSPGNRAQRSGHFRHGTAIVAGVRVPVPGSEYDYDEREAEDLANAMLDEDEIFDHEDEDELAERDLDDDVPEAAESEQAWEHTDTELDLDLEDSEMDISMLAPSATGISHMSAVRLPPPQSRVSLTGSRRSDVRHSGAYAQQRQRRSSGPWITDPSPAAPHTGGTSSGRSVFDQQQQQLQFQQATAPRARMVSGNRRQYLQTWDTPEFSSMSRGGDGAHDSQDADADDDDDEDEEDLLDPFNSSNAPRQSHAQAHQRPVPPPRPYHHASHPTDSLDNHNHTLGENPTPASSTRNPSANTSSTRNAARSWLDGAAAVVGGGARRTLFARAAARRAQDAASAADADRGGGSGGQGQGQGQGRAGSGSGSGSGGASSGGLFTPSPFAGRSGTGAGAGSGAGNGAGSGVGAWDDTPITADQSQGQGQTQGQGQRQGDYSTEDSQQRQHQRRRSGRFLTTRRRAAADGAAAD